MQTLENILQKQHHAADCAHGTNIEDLHDVTVMYFKKYGSKVNLYNVNRHYPEEIFYLPHDSNAGPS